MDIWVMSISWLMRIIPQRTYESRYLLDIWVPVLWIKSQKWNCWIMWDVIKYSEICKWNICIRNFLKVWNYSKLSSSFKTHARWRKKKKHSFEISKCYSNPTAQPRRQSYQCSTLMQRMIFPWNNRNCLEEKQPYFSLLKINLGLGRVQVIS